MDNVVLDRTDTNALMYASLSDCKRLQNEVQADELAEILAPSVVFFAEDSEPAFAVARSWAEVIVENKKKILEILNW